MTEKNLDLKQPALQMMTAGFSIIPCNADKKAALPWKPYQDRLMTPAEINKHFGSAERLASVCFTVFVPTRLVSRNSTAGGESRLGTKSMYMAVIITV